MQHMNPRSDLYPENVSKIDKVKLYCARWVRVLKVTYALMLSKNNLSNSDLKKKLLKTATSNVKQTIAPD